MKNSKDRRNREKKEDKLDIYISNHEIRFLNFLRFTAFAIHGFRDSVPVRKLHTCC